MSRLLIGFFASGNGSLFEYLAEHCQSGDLNADARLLICSNPKAKVLERAERLRIPAINLRQESCESDSDYSARLLRILKQHDVNFICLAGCLKRIPSRVVQDYRHRILNIHPALLPAFGGQGMYGHHVHEAVIESGARLSGATVHLVDEEYDHGPIVLQRALFVKPTDTPDSLGLRVHSLEFDLYLEAVRLFTADRISVAGRRVNILPSRTS
jgi:phosphoribosylglycinamide formyltransferase 1